MNNNRKDYREAFVKEPLTSIDWNEVNPKIDYSSLYPTDGKKFILKDE